VSLILDTGAVYAWYDRDDRWHRPVRELLEDEPGALIVPSPIIPEVDHLLGAAIGVDAQLAFYEDLAAPSYLVADLEEGAYQRVLELNRQYRDLRLGFVDAAVMVMAETLGIGRIVTVDRRDFSAVTLLIQLELLP
jgi:uncharacterized protein